MTICIAAICESAAKSPKIVLCSDTKGSSHLGTTYQAFKEDNLGDYWNCLAAGLEDECIAIVAILRRIFIAKDVIDETNIVPLIREGLQQRKIEKADELILGKWGMSYAAFRKAKAEFPDALFERDMLEVANITLAADFIIAGFLEDGFPMILETDRNAVVKIRENYCVIGEGAYLAQSGLMHRDHSEHDTLARTLYSVFEAKKYAQRISTVGPETRITIHGFESPPPQTLSEKGEAHLADLFERHGPRPLIEEDHVSVPADLLESVYAHLAKE